MTTRKPRPWRRMALGTVLVGGLLAVALWPDTLAVDAAVAARGPLVVTIDEQGETRIRDRHVVSAPVTGRVERITLEPGDTVAAGQVLTRVRPDAPPLLDARTRAEARAGVEAAQAALGRAQMERARADDALGQARREQQRAADLFEGGAVSRQQLDARTDAARQAEAAARAAAFAEREAASALRQAEARLAPPAAPVADGRAVPVRAPAAGVVLKRVYESEALVPAGEPLLEIGDPSRLEIVADLLSADAVRVPPGARVLVDGWGGDRTLEARVRLVEPAGFTKVSALGVEEQRVNVRLDFVDPAAARTALGDAYRVDVRIVLWEGTDVLTVPTGALFRDGERWAVFVVAGGRAARTPVDVGHRTAQSAEIVSGIDAGTTVVVYPPDTLAPGMRVAPRAGG